MGLAANSVTHGFELDDILFVREHWQGMTVKELAKNGLMTEKQVRAIISEYDLRGEEYLDKDFRNRIKKEFGSNHNVANSLRVTFRGFRKYEKEAAEGEIMENDSIYPKLIMWYVCSVPEPLSYFQKRSKISHDRMKALFRGEQVYKDDLQERMARGLCIDISELDGVIEKVNGWDYEELNELYTEVEIDDLEVYNIAERVMEKALGDKNLTQYLGRKDGYEFQVISKMIRGLTKVNIFSLEKFRESLRLSYKQFLTILEECRQESEIVYEPLELIYRYYKEVHNGD